MNDDDIKNIRRAVKEEIGSALIPIKAVQSKHTSILNQHTAVLDKHSATLDSHTKTLDQLTRKLDTVWDQTVQLSEDMTEVKVAVKSISVDITQTKNRVTAIEDHLGL
jgi:septal ring factor EnvC (AmiA/AmiB activator)